VLSRLFRGKFIAGLRALFDEGRLRLGGEVKRCPKCGENRMRLLLAFGRQLTWTYAPSMLTREPAGCDTS
jgi:hypothetical protein